MTLAHWWFLVAAVPAAAAFVFLAGRGERRARSAALNYSRLAFIESAVGRSPPWGATFIALWAASILAFGLALAQPSVMALVPIPDAAVVLCIDTSGSMSSTDVEPTRSAASQAAALTFINGVPDGTRLGIVAFSSSAIPLGPLTDDRDVAREELERLPFPNGGTAIGDALDTASRLLPPFGRRVVVLVTDGVNNMGADPLEVAQTLGASGVTIFTVGIGTNGSGQLIPGTGESAALDEDALRAIAQAGNGNYALVADAGSLRRRLGELAKITVRERRRVDLSLACALSGGVLALGAALGALALGRFP